MIDTIKFRLELNDNNKHSIILNFNNKVKNIVTVDSPYGKYKLGHFENLKLKLTSKYLQGQGSLAKLFCENNISNLNFNENCNAILKIEEFFNISLNNAVVLRIDLGQNIKLENPIGFYLKLFVSPKGYKDFKVNNETREFRSYSDSIMFYDKVKEAKKGNKLFLMPSKNENILRYERKFKNSIRTTFGHSILIGDLKVPSFYNKLLDIWYYDYVKLTKITDIQYSYPLPKTLSEFKEWLIISSIQKLGINNVHENINGLKLTYNQKWKIKTFLNQVTKQHSSSPFLLLELNNGITSAYNFAKAA